MKINEIYLGDCLELMPKHVEDKSIDMIFCDLPYGTTRNKWDSVIPLNKLWSEYKRVIKDNGVICLTASQPFTSALISSNYKMFKHEWIWIKDKGSNFANTVREPMKEHEQVLIFSKGKWTYNRIMEERKGGGAKAVGRVNKHYKKSENYGLFKGSDISVKKLRVPSSLQKFNRETGLHPTQKPLALIEYMIKTYTNEGDLILDNTCGSGTTGLGAKNLNRNYIMMEQDPKYYEIACNRVQG